MDLIYITNVPLRAIVAQRAGVDRVMVDLEIIGKKERQGNLDTVISNHNLRDVEEMRAILKTSNLMVRINPIHDNSNEEITRVIRLGAEIVMLPMFRRVAEVRDFVRMVSGRAKTCLLLETGSALARAREILGLDGIDEVFIGLNDLHLELKLDFMFEVLAGGLIDYLASILRDKKCKFGFGGVARIGKGKLKSELVLSEHRRLGSSLVILSRDFNRLFESENEDIASRRFADDVRAIRTRVSELKNADVFELQRNAEELKRSVREIVSGSELDPHNGAGH
ncbi:MAG TPA: aldolase [Deltaproteobacteria bacterium]|nr:aldolase [Deltaproteobacteria bacterium]